MITSKGGGLAIVLCALLGAPLHAEDSPADADADYTRVINERSDKIVVQLGIENDAEKLRVRDLIADQYRKLSTIHDARGAGTMTAEKAQAEQYAAHRRFVAQLESRLTSEQVNQVKDGLTYGVVPHTYRAYLDLLPPLTDEQQREIMAHLLEAREYAMDAGSADEKHSWFGKYKGRINNYLSAQGYDLKRAERDRAANSK